MTVEQRIQEIRDRLAYCNELTPGPWRWHRDNVTPEHYAAELVNDTDGLVWPVAFDDGTAYMEVAGGAAEIIANAPADIAFLLAEIDRLAKELTLATAQVKAAEDHYHCGEYGYCGIEIYNEMQAAWDKALNA